MSGGVRRVAIGAGWLYGYRWVERLLELISIVVLARILVPEDFGLVAIAASVMAIVEGLSDFDVHKALIRIRDDRRSLYDTAWTLSSLRGLLTALVMLAIAALLGEPRLAAVLAALAASPLLKGLSNPRFVTFERDLVYSRLALLTLGARIAAFAVTLGVALVYRSYWALVAGILTGAAVSAVLSYVLRPYLPRPSLARSAELLAFSGWMLLATMVTTLAMETDKLIVGRLLGVADAGIYFMTQRIGVLPTRELISPLQRILFPSFSEIAGERQRLRRVAGESINVLGSLSLPAGCGFALVADRLVPLALGEGWQPVVPLIRVLVPFLGLRASLSMTLPCVMALGRTRLLFQVSLVYALVHLPVFIWATASYGLMGSIVGIVAAGLFYSYLNVWLLRRTLDISFGRIAAALRRPLAATAAMVAGLLALQSLALPVAPWLALALEIAVGAALFGAVQYGLWRLEGRPPGIERRLLELRRR